MSGSASGSRNFRSILPWLVAGLALLGMIALLPGNWGTAYGDTIPGQGQNQDRDRDRDEVGRSDRHREQRDEDTHSGQTAHFDSDTGHPILVTAPPDLPSGDTAKVRFDSKPDTANDAEAGSLGGGNAVNQGGPIRLTVQLLNAAGNPLAPSTIPADTLVTLHLPVLSSGTFAWLMEVKNPDGSFLGYQRVPATYDPATNSLVYQVPFGTLATGLDLLPVQIVPAYLKPFTSDAHMFSGYADDATDFGPVNSGNSSLVVVGPQVGDRIFVYNPTTDNYGWVNASGVGPVEQP